MIRFTIRLLMKNKVLWLWPVFSVGFALVIGIWGDVQTAQNSYSFMIGAGAAMLPSGVLIPHIIGVMVLIGVLGFPTHFQKNIESERAALILSEPISRNDFFWSDFAGVLLVSVFYTLVTIVTFAVLLMAKAGIFPVEFFIAILAFTPLYVLTYYISIVLLLILTDSYLASILIGYFLIGFLAGLMINADQFLTMLGYNSKITHGVINVLSYFIPSSAGIQKLIRTVLSGGFVAFNGRLFVFSLASCIPFLIISFLLMQRKEF